MDRANLPSAHVCLIGGSSSVGKTVVAESIGHQLGVPVVRVDGIVGESSDSSIHFPDGVPEAWHLDPPYLRDRLVARGEALANHLDTIIKEFMQDARGAVIEGEGVQPDLSLSWAACPTVRYVMIVEEDEERLRETLRTRASGWKFDQLSRGEQETVVRMNALYGRWVRERAISLQIPCVPSQPFGTLVERVLSLVS